MESKSSLGLICPPNGPHICKMIHSMHLSKLECALSGEGNSNPHKGQAGTIISTAGRVLRKGGDWQMSTHGLSQRHSHQASQGDYHRRRNMGLLLLEFLILQRSPQTTFIHGSSENLELLCELNKTHLQVRASPITPISEPDIAPLRLLQGQRARHLLNFKLIISTLPARDCY